MVDYPGDGEDFGDESEESNDEIKGGGSDEFARMLEESFKGQKKKLSVGDKVRGEVLVVGKEDVFVSVGALEGVIPRKEVYNEAGQVTCRVGDVLDLFVTQVRGADIFLSPNPTSKNLADDIEDAFDMMLPVEGKVVEVCKGGFRVQIHGKLAFCPVSQMDIRFIETPEEYVGRKFEFRISQFSEGGRNIVVSRRKILEEERELSAGSFLEEHKDGDVVKGRVARLEKFGAFIELAPGIDGLAHVSELAWSRVADPAEVVTVGQEVMVKILKIEAPDRAAGGKFRIALSIKQAGAEPWDNLPSHLKEGSVVDGKVTRLMKFGAFVEVTPGIEGLIPLSEMSYTKRVMRADEFVKEGEAVAVMVKEINPETKRILLSLKDAGSDPWALVSSKFPVGAIVPGVVERREPYGLFIRIDDGVTGLLPKSKANERPEFPFEKLKPGDSVTIQVAEIRREERRISLDVPKDAGSEDWKSYAAASTSSSSSLGTLGGAFGEKLKAALQPSTEKKRSSK